MSHVQKRLRIPDTLNTFLLTDSRIQNPLNINHSTEKLIIAILQHYYSQPDNLSRIMKATSILAPKTQVQAQDQPQPQDQSQA